ncbi:MAG: DMT family transporter [Acidaminococcaceae bacterium]|nr:DMT family transporter [Acidaminococcaceae bacterium]MDD4721841.1 DMT family transporter [Acidaminococcaceae bacterium]
MGKNSKTTAYFSAVIYALIIGLSFLFVKMALSVTDPLTVLAHRFTIAFLILLIASLFGWGRVKLSAKDVLYILPISLFYPTFFFAFQIFGLVYISSSEAGIIQAIIPVFTMILASIFLKETTSSLQKIALSLSVLGVIYIFFMQGISWKSANFIGIVLIMFSALSSACYNVMARKITKKYRLIDITYVMTTIGFISFNILSVTDHLIKNTLDSYFAPFMNTTFVISVLYLGILSSLLTSLLSNYTLSKIAASKMSVFSNLATLITVIAGSVFLHEQIEYYHIIGAAMIILGIIGINFLGHKTTINQN